MKRAILLSLLPILFLLVSTLPTQGLTQEFWVKGTVVTAPMEEIYSETRYWQFNFTIAETDNETLAPAGSVFLVLCPKTLNTTAILKDDVWNFTGALIDVKVDERPLNAFVVSQINIKQPPGTSDIIHLIIQALSGVVGGIATTIATLVTITTGYVIPEWIISLVIVFCAFFWVVKNAKTIGIVLVLILVFLVISGGANVLRIGLGWTQWSPR